MEGGRRTEQETRDESLKSPKRIFLELGTHSLPVPILGSKEFKGDDLYVGIDIDRDVLQKGKGYLVSKKDFPNTPDHTLDNIIFLQADALKLPVRDGVVDEVFLGNLLGTRSMSDQTREQIIQEARRVLAKGGKVVVKETMVPLRPEVLEGLMVKQGFIRQSDIISGYYLNEWKNNVAPYDTFIADQPFRLKTHPYFIVFILKQEEMI